MSEAAKGMARYLLTRLWEFAMLVWMPMAGSESMVTVGAMSWRGRSWSGVAGTADMRVRRPMRHVSMSIFKDVFIWSVPTTFVS